MQVEEELHVRRPQPWIHRIRWTHRGHHGPSPASASRPFKVALAPKEVEEPVSQAGHGRSSMVQEVIRFAHRCPGEGNSKERPAKLIWSRFWAPKLEHHGYSLAFFEGTWTYE